MLNDTRRRRFTLYGLVAITLIIVHAPYYWVVRASFLDLLVAGSLEGPIIPFFSDAFTLQGYEQIMGQYNFVRFFGNSIFLALSCTLLALVFAIPAAYAFARLDFPGRKLLFYTAVFTVMFPWIVITIPVYEIFYVLNLLNTYPGLIIALTAFVLPLVVWLLQGFFRQGIPANIEEAALLDGHSELGAFLRIVLPLSMPAVAATGLFAFLAAWNNFLWVFILTSNSELHTATVAIHSMMGSDVTRNWTAIMAGVTLLIIPPVVFYALSQRYVGEGLGGGY